MIKGEGEGGCAFMSNTYYMKKKINNDKRRDMVVGKVVVHLCLTRTNHMKLFLTMIREGTWKKGRWWRIYV
jgi:hypothetical protein